MHFFLNGLAAWVIAVGLLSGAKSEAGRDGSELARERMVEQLREDEGLANARLLEAIREIPRHCFVPKSLEPMAYYDMALPIGRGQTISPPSMVAGMIDRLDPQPGDRVLEVGTGTGYQAAVLSRMVSEVFTIEIVGALARKARSTLKRLGCANVQVRTGDGYLGWPERAPFDRIIVACSPERVPRPLIDQLREGGRMVVPVGVGYEQTLYVLTKTNGFMVREAVAPTVFVPMVGRADGDRADGTSRFEPALVNGGFEELLPGTPRVKGWYHQRQLKQASAADAPEGASYAVFENRSPGRTAEASQAFALEGDRFQELVLAGWVKGDEIEWGVSDRERASWVLACYNAKRELIGITAAGDWLGTFDWRRFEQRVRVPAATREAILRVGLCGGTGRLSLDGLRLTVGR